MIKGIFPLEHWNFGTQALLEGLPPKDLERLTAHMTESRLKRGEVIFREGSYPTGIFYILEGKAKKFKRDKEGREQIIYVANAGELIGYHALLADERYPDGAAALEASRIAFIPRKDFLTALHDSPVLSQRILKAISHEFSVFVNNIATFAWASVRQRLAIQLILLREKYKKDFKPGMEVAITLSREDLASLVGTARENIIRTLKEFKELGIVETKGRTILIKDVKQLIKISGY